MTALCASCGDECRMTDGREVYPHHPDLEDKKIYVCDPCDARVGCHPGTDTPLGTVATATLRSARMAVHALLDPLWKNDRRVRRGTAYAYLAEKMGLAQDDCHVGMFDAKQCSEATMILRDVKPSNILTWRTKQRKRTRK